MLRNYDRLCKPMRIDVDYYDHFVIHMESYMDDDVELGELRTSYEAVVHTRYCTDDGTVMDIHDIHAVVAAVGDCYRNVNPYCPWLEDDEVTCVL